MAFTGHRFSFNRIPCEEFGLYIYDIDNFKNKSTPFASTGKLQTDVLPFSGRTFLYGRSYESPLEFSLVFGVHPEDVEIRDYLDRFEMDAIANWLTGPTTYQWLEIEQPDLECIRYHCIITNLEPIHVDWLPFAFSAKIQCDSPYGYYMPQKFQFVCTGETIITLNNRSTVLKPYYPKLDVRMTGSASLKIINQTYQNAAIEFQNLPNSNLSFSIDNELGVIQASDSVYSNLYKYFNFNWLPLRMGMNRLRVLGNCTLEFTCEFPVNFGG